MGIRKFYYRMIKMGICAVTVLIYIYCQISSIGPGIRPDSQTSLFWNIIFYTILIWGHRGAVKVQSDTTSFYFRIFIRPNSVECGKILGSESRKQTEGRRNNKLTLRICSGEFSYHMSHTKIIQQGSLQNGCIRNSFEVIYMNKSMKFMITA